MLAFFLLPFFFFALFFLVVFQKTSVPGLYTRLRAAFLKTSLLASLLLVIMTEYLSSRESITLKGLVISWSLVLAIPLGYLIWSRSLTKSLKETTKPLFAILAKNWMIKVMFAFLIISFVLAVIYPPNNYDSMTYHMARVAHWIQNESISYYQTHNTKQINFPPFAEWVILHLQILAGNDRLANAVQLFFFAGCIINVSLIIKALRGSFQQQLLGAFFTCLIPMAVIESNTTQNDVVVAFFILSFIYYVVRLLEQISVSNLFFAGISLGLAWLTKGTSYLFTLFFCLWMVLLLIKNYRSPLRDLIKRALLFSLIPILAILVNSGVFYRNIFFSGTPLGNASGALQNEGFDPKSLMLVSVKNFMNHMPVNDWIKTRLSYQMSKLGVDINDPKYSYNTMHWMITGFSFHEDYAQNFVHALLIVLVGWMFFRRRKLYSEPISHYTLFVITVYFTLAMYCLILKWQPWSNRLETGLFMTFCVPLAMEIGKMDLRWQRWCYFPMLGYGTAALLLSTYHPILPIPKTIFANPYSSFLMQDEGLPDAAKYIATKPYKKIGVLIGADSWDYPYYNNLAGRGGRERIIKHVFVRNQSQIYLDNFIPDVILSTSTTPKYFVYAGKNYVRTNIFKGGPAVYEIQ